jgi:hypothetical protein
MTKNRLNSSALTFVATALLLGLALTPIASPSAAAQQGTINPEQACRDDAFRFCNNFIPDRDKVGACLRRNARSLSRDCRTVVTGGGGARRATRRAVRHHNRHHS